jgi:NADH dehydrogenase
MSSSSIGFGRLFAAKALRRADVRVTLIATCSSRCSTRWPPASCPGDTHPRPENCDVTATPRCCGLVTDVDLAERTVLWRHLDEVRTTTYDQLVVAAGAGQSYFGHPEFETFAPGMKSLDDALELRARIFGAFERAEIATDDAARARELTFVVVGGGPTGVEMAGQIRELATTTLAQDFRRLDPRDAKVVLLDGATQILPAFGSDLGARARRALENKGVDVRLQAMVRHVGAEGVTYADAEGAQHTILCGTTVWAAGVQASPLGALLATQCGLETDRAGRVPVAADLSLPPWRGLRGG